MYVWKILGILKIYSMRAARNQWGKSGFQGGKMLLFLYEKIPVTGIFPKIKLVRRNDALFPEFSSKVLTFRIL